MLVVCVGSLAGNVVAQLDKVLGELAKTANDHFCSSSAQYTVVFHAANVFPRVTKGYTDRLGVTIFF